MGESDKFEVCVSLLTIDQKELGTPVLEFEQKPEFEVLLDRIEQHFSVAIAEACPLTVQAAKRQPVP